MQYWLIAAKRNKGEEILGLMQAIGLAFAGKIEDKVYSDLMPDYNLDSFDDDDISDAELKDQAAAFFGYPMGATVESEVEE